MLDLPATYILLRGSKRPRTRAELRTALEPALKDVLTQVCLWDDDANVGDYRFCVIGYDLPGGVDLFIQLWSEPGDPVLCEVSSGNWNPPTGVYLAGPRATRIEAMGFEMGGEAANYQKEVDVTSARHVTALVRHLIALLYDAFDYRGQQALRVQAVADSRTTLRPVFTSMTPDDLWRILEDAGYKCGDIEDDDGAPARLSVYRHGIRAVATLISPAPDDMGFEVIALGLAVGDEMRVLWLAGGVTASWLEHQVADWFNDQREEKKGKEPKRRVVAVRPKISRSIH